LLHSRDQQKKIKKVYSTDVEYKSCFTNQFCLLIHKNIITTNWLRKKYGHIVVNKEFVAYCISIVINCILVLTSKKLKYPSPPHQILVLLSVLLLLHRKNKRT